jgi:hypothetical protein
MDRGFRGRSAGHPGAEASLVHRRSILILLGALLLLALSGSASAAILSPPQLTQAEIERAVERTLASGERPRELKAPRPAWFTPAVEERLRRDGGVTTAPVDAPLPGEVGIRPGSWMVSPFLCTMNFIFQKSTTLAIGTAGHCIESGEPVVLLTVAPTGGNPVLVELGRVLLKRDGGIGKDYALVEIPPARHPWVFPTLAVVGGPCGVYAGGDPWPVAHYGHGVGIGTGGTPRAGIGFELASDPGIVKGADWDWDADSIVWLGLISPGDSGSPVRIAQLPAVSNLTHGIGITGLEPSALAWGTRVTTITSSGWQLVNSPLCV